MPTRSRDALTRGLRRTDEGFLPLPRQHAFGIPAGTMNFETDSNNRGVALLIRKGNRLGIRSLSDVLQAGTRVAISDTGDARAKSLAAANELLGKALSAACTSLWLGFQALVVLELRCRRRYIRKPPRFDEVRGGADRPGGVSLRPQRRNQAM